MFSMSKGETRFLGATIMIGLLVMGLVVLAAVAGIGYLLVEGAKAVFA